ncbi:hypothetical protein Naga_100236g2 [Nannochloropsis gaditana]|uniref:Uncharacterized protein n=1 Tax=Nannochloropsis gaditana TaxID=72520 RepID=W7TPS3_9STRA|nr:hypothetical protein Naga_100236g2 [Nannochloropsis gaditana]
MYSRQSVPLARHPCTRGIKLGNDVLRTPAFLRIENYIFHTPDFFQRRDRLFSYPRGKTPLPAPLLLSTQHDMGAGSRSGHHEPSRVASSKIFLRRGVDIFALKEKILIQHQKCTSGPLPSVSGMPIVSITNVIYE